MMVQVSQLCDKMQQYVDSAGSRTGQTHGSVGRRPSVHACTQQQYQTSTPHTQHSLLLLLPAQLPTWLGFSFCPSVHTV